MAGKSFRDLETWQRAVDLVEEIYLETKSFPKDEIYGLTGQMRRAALSIPSNIAEGQGRDSPKEFLRFLSIAYGSLCETQTQLLIACRLGYLDEPAHRRLTENSERVGRLMNGLVKSLRSLPPTTDNRQPTTLNE